MLNKKFILKYVVILLACALAGCTKNSVEQPPQVSPSRITLTATPTEIPIPIVTPSSTSTPAASSTPEIAFQGSIVFTSISRKYSAIAILNLRDESIEDLSGNGAHSISWSPDGQWVAFDGGIPPSQQIDIYMMKSDRSELKRLTNSPSGKSYIDWSPDSKFLAYTHENHTQPSDLAMINVNDSKTYMLTTTLGYESYPAWSSDGSKIAYLYAADGNSTHELWLMDVATKNSKRLINFPVAFGKIAWSPNEDRIAFVSAINSEECGDIYLVRSDGGDLTRLTNLSGCATDVVWSPDGSYLAFVGRNEAVGNIMDWGWQIYVIDIKRQNIVAVTHEKEWMIKDIDWTAAPAKR